MLAQMPTAEEQGVNVLGQSNSFVQTPKVDALLIWKGAAALHLLGP